MDDIQENIDEYNPLIVFDETNAVGNKKTYPIVTLLIKDRKLNISHFINAQFCFEIPKMFSLSSRHYL